MCTTRTLGNSVENYPKCENCAEKFAKDSGTGRFCKEELKEIISVKTDWTFVPCCVIYQKKSCEGVFKGKVRSKT